MIDWKKTSAIVAAVTVAGVTATASANSVIAFDEDASGGSLNHGDVVYHELYDGTINTDRDLPGADLVIDNRADGGARPDAGVIYNSNSTQSNDPDLQAPFTAGNATDKVKGNMLIVQENEFFDLRDGNAQTPDDEAKGELSMIFDFYHPITSFQFDLVDFGDDGQEGELKFLNQSGDTLQTVDLSHLDENIPGIVYGNNTANRIGPDHYDPNGIPLEFSGVELDFNDSVAVDNITTTTAVPTPTAAAGLLLMGGGLLLRRRMSHAATV